MRGSTYHYLPVNFHQRDHCVASDVSLFAHVSGVAARHPVEDVGMVEVGVDTRVVGLVASPAETGDADQEPAVVLGVVQHQRPARVAQAGVSEVGDAANHPLGQQARPVAVLGVGLAVVVSHHLHPLALHQLLRLPAAVGGPAPAGRHHPRLGRRKFQIVRQTDGVDDLGEVDRPVQLYQRDVTVFVCIPVLQLQHSPFDIADVHLRRASTRVVHAKDQLGRRPLGGLLQGGQTVGGRDHEPVRDQAAGAVRQVRDRSHRRRLLSDGDDPRKFVLTCFHAIDNPCASCAGPPTCAI